MKATTPSTWLKCSDPAMGFLLHLQQKLIDTRVPATLEKPLGTGHEKQGEVLLIRKNPGCIQRYAANIYLYYP